MKKEIEFFIPMFPISTQHGYINRAIGKGKMIRFLSKKAKDFKDLVKEVVTKAYPTLNEKNTYFGSIDLEVEIYLYAKTKRKYDWDNMNKFLMDSLEGYIYDDDKQVIKGTVIKGYNKDKPGILIKIRPFIKE